MARSLSSRRRRIATVDVPRPYRAGHRKILDADAAVVDLHKFCPYYYTVGTHLLAFQLTEAADIARSMLLVMFIAFFVVLLANLFLVDHTACCTISYWYHNVTSLSVMLCIVLNDALYIKSV